MKIVVDTPTGKVKIQRDDGKVFVIRPESPTPSPLDVQSINLGVTTEDILECIHDGRVRNAYEPV